MDKNKLVRCSGGCGRTQDVIIKARVSEGFTATRPWTCLTCAQKEANRKARADAARPVPEAKAKPDKGFTVRPRRVAAIATSVQRESEGPSIRPPAGGNSKVDQAPAGEPQPVSDPSATT